MTNKLKKMKSALQSELSEWLGFDIPKEGSEDYEAWTSRASVIDDISSFGDVYSYLQEDDDRAEEFFARFGISDFRLVI